MKTIDSLKWQPNTLQVKPGQMVTIDVANTGMAPHGFFSPALKIVNVPIDPHGNASVKFTAPQQPGVYQFWCSVSAHAVTGMVGEVVVG